VALWCGRTHKPCDFSWVLVVSEAGRVPSLLASVFSDVLMLPYPLPGNHQFCCCIVIMICFFIGWFASGGSSFLVH
jgi:hypothetical protein